MRLMKWFQDTNCIHFMLCSLSIASPSLRKPLAILPKKRRLKTLEIAFLPSFTRWLFVVQAKRGRAVMLLLFRLLRLCLHFLGL